MKQEVWSIAFGNNFFAVTFMDGRVADAPGFARAMLGMTKEEARRYVYRNDGRYECLTENQTSSSGLGV